MLGRQVTVSTSPDAGCTRRAPGEISRVWAALADRRSPASIFLTPEWIAVARAHDTAEDITLTAGDPPYGVAALARQTDGTLAFAGGELTDEQDLVVDSGAHASGAHAAFAHALARWIDGERAPRIALSYVPEDSPTLDLLAAALAPGYVVTRARLVTSPRITLAADFESYVHGLGKKERHELRRKLRRFESTPGTGFRWASDAERATVLDRFFALHRLSKGEKAAFMTAQTEAFFRDVADAMAACGRLRLGVVRAFDEDAAVLFAFAYRDTLALYNAAYDPALGSLSLGIASHAYAVREAITERFAVYDLLRGDEPYKYDLGAADRWLARLEAVRA